MIKKVKVSNETNNVVHLIPTLKTEVEKTKLTIAYSGTLSMVVVIDVKSKDIGYLDQ